MVLGCWGLEMSDGARVQVGRRCHRKFEFSYDATQSDPRVSEGFALYMGFNSIGVSQSVAALLVQPRRLSSARMSALASLVVLLSCSSWLLAERVDGLSAGRGQQLRRALQQTDRHTQTADISGRWDLLDLASRILGGEQAVDR